MRISGGEWRGRILKVPAGDAVRPTQDRVREAVFSMIQCELPGANVLDMFAGAGSVGLEALSRGAARATFVEAAPRHAAVLAANAQTLGAAARVEIVRADVYAWLERQRANAFDLAYADPPYETGAARGYAAMLRTLAERGIVRPGGIFIAEMKAHQTPDEDPGWELRRDRAYGQTRIALYRRKDES